MSSPRTPTGQLPKSVYWRRRIVVLVVLIAIIAIIAIIAWPRDASTSTPPAGSGSTSAPPTGGSTEPPVAGDPCDPTKITVTAETDAASYDPGVNPQLWLTITSKQAAECVLAAGTDVQEYRITSGDELIWSSLDCQSDAAPHQQILKPGVPVSSAPITWDRTRSAPDTCDVVRDAVIADGASYHLEVVVGDLTSKTTKQFLLF
jgi:hypothetical protein